MVGLDLPTITIGNHDYRVLAVDGDLTLVQQLHPEKSGYRYVGWIRTFPEIKFTHTRQVNIDGRGWVSVERQGLTETIERVLLINYNDARKYAIFSNGDFCEWEDKKAHKLTLNLTDTLIKNVSAQTELRDLFVAQIANAYQMGVKELTLNDVAAVIGSR